jgi:hypothetical protein
MKISTFIYILLFVGIIFFVMASMVSESNDKYGTGINTSLWEGKYDYSESINNNMTGFITSLDDIANPDKGWLAKIGAGFTGIISAVMLLPRLMWSSFTMSGGLINGVGTSIGLPAYIISIFIIALIIWGIFSLIAFYQRWVL